MSQQNMARFRGIVRAIIVFKRMYLRVQLIQQATVIGQFPQRSNIFFSAAKDGRIYVLKLLLKSRLTNINEINNQGWSALTYATANGKVEVVKLLLRDTRLDPNNTRVTAVMIASVQGRIGILELLLEDHRTNRIHPGKLGGNFYEIAMSNVLRRRAARFRGIVRTIVVLKRMRMYASDLSYKPGGIGFKKVKDNFHEIVRKQEREKKRMRLYGPDNEYLWDKIRDSTWF